MLASGSPRELLALDAADPLVRLDRHPLWAAVLDGTLAPERLGDLAVAFYPSLAGTARYLFSSKVSTLAAEDGKTVYRQLYDALTVPEADADAGWRDFALAVGATPEELDEALASPAPEAADYVALARGFGHRSAHEGVGAAWGVERQLPALWGRVAEALGRRYRVPGRALAYLRYQGTIAPAVERHVMALVDRYLDDPWKTYEARRAARECVWAWKSIADRIMEERPWRAERDATG
jgi:pyrroloquinoline quinone (PQQ) biosynthesis protein C